MAITMREKRLVNENVATLAEVEEKIKAIAATATAENPEEIEIVLDHSNYRLTKPMVLSAKEIPGLAHVSLTFRPKNGMRPVISDLVGIPGGEFTPVKGKKYLMHQFEKGADGKYPLFHDFYVNGKLVPMAKSEVYRNPLSFGAKRNKPLAKDDPMGLYVPFALAEKLAQEPLSGAELQMYVEWEWYNLRVKEVVLSDTKEVEGKNFALVKLFEEEYKCLVEGINGCLDVGGRECFFLNALSFLTEPGSYVYDYHNGRLYYMPTENESWWTAYEYPALENLLTLEGLRNTVFEGITFKGTTSKFICENGYCAGQANNEKRVEHESHKNGGNSGQLPHAALITHNMRDFSLRGCTFTEIGTNGAQLRDSNTRVHIYDCRFENIGMSALMVGNPTTAWEKPENRNININIINNLFCHIGYTYPTAVGIYIGMVDGLKLTHNTIRETAYSAVSIGWGWSLVGYELGEKVNIRDAEVAYNRITDYMQLLRDGAAIYVLGANCTADRGGQFNFMHDNYAQRELFCDASKRGYYMDGSSSNWEVYDNVTSGTHLPVFSQFHCSDQFTHHNYIHDIYTTNKIDSGNHAPWRDTILGEWYYVGEGIEALFAAYPKAKEIFEASGCDLEG